MSSTCVRSRPIAAMGVALIAGGVGVPRKSVSSALSRSMLASRSAAVVNQVWERLARLRVDDRVDGAAAVAHLARLIPLVSECLRIDGLRQAVRVAVRLKTPSVRFNAGSDDQAGFRVDHVPALNDRVHVAMVVS